jgi:hypothetical protein
MPDKLILQCLLTILLLRFDSPFSCQAQSATNLSGGYSFSLKPDYSVLLPTVALLRKFCLTSVSHYTGILLVSTGGFS